MIIIYYCSIPEKLSEEAFQLYLQMVPQVFAISINTIKNQEAKLAGLFGKLLLKKALQDISHNTLGLDDVETDQYKRPYINSKIDFNISHSGKYVLCAISDATKVGVDIEHMLPVNFADFKRILGLKEWEILQESSDPLHTFYTIWTKKEAAIKADGRGFSIPTDKIEVKQDLVQIENQYWNTKSISIDNDYAAAVATKEAIDVVEIRHIEFL